jgi:hypothetical protein
VFSQPSHRVVTLYKLNLVSDDVADLRLVSDQLVEADRLIDRLVEVGLGVRMLAELINAEAGSICAKKSKLKVSHVYLPSGAGPLGRRLFSFDFLPSAINILSKLVEVMSQGPLVIPTRLVNNFAQPLGIVVFVLAVQNVDACVKDVAVTKVLKLRQLGD